MTTNQLSALRRVLANVPMVDLEVSKSRFGVVNPGEKYNLKVADCTPQWAEFFATFDPVTINELLNLVEAA